MSQLNCVTQSVELVSSASELIRVNTSDTLRLLSTLALSEVFEDPSRFIPVSSRQEGELLQTMARVDSRYRDGHHTNRLSVGFMTPDPEGIVIGPIPILNHRFSGTSEGTIADDSIITVYPYVIDGVGEGTVIDMAYPMAVTDDDFAQVNAVNSKILLPLAEGQARL